MHLILSLRPSQWTKNVFVFAGLVFSGRLRDLSAVHSAALAFAVFCLLSGVVYLVNDVRDREADRRHPTKSRRPIASGALAPSVAIGFAVILTVVAMATALSINRSFARSTRSR